MSYRFAALMWKSLPFDIAFFLVIFLFFGVRQMLHADPYFQVEKITVFPAGILNPEELRFLEEETKGKSLLEINLNELSQTLERDPKVERAEVVRLLPKQLNVYLIKRLPIVQVQVKPDGPYYLVSSDQVVISTSAQARPDLLILEDYRSVKKNYSVGMLYPNTNFESLCRILLSIRNEIFLRHENLVKMTTDDMGHLSLFLKDGLELKIGKQFSLSPTAQMVLSSLLKSKERAEYLYLDLRYRDILVKKKTDS